MNAGRFPSVAVLLVLAACNSDAAGPPPSVRYVIDAPFCGGKFPMQFFIDNAQIGVDTFAVNTTPLHLTSKDFETTVGPHTIGARLASGYVWPNRSVNLAPGQVYTDSLPFYCS